MADLPWGALSGFAAGFPDTTDLIPFERVTGTTRTPSGDTHDKIFPMLDIRLFGAKGDGVTSDTAAVKAALNAIQLAGGPHFGRTLWVPKGTYILNPVNVNSWGSYFQSGPVRIRAEQDAIFEGGAIDDWLNNPVPAQNDPLAFNPPLHAHRFLQLTRTGGSGSLGFPLDIEGLTFRNWTHVFRQDAVSYDNQIPLFRLARCRFEQCYGPISTWAGAPATFDRIEIIYSTFFKCNVAVNWSGNRWQNVLIHGNFVDMCSREGFRFGYNTDDTKGFGVGILEQHEWRRVIFSFNCITRIGKSAFDPFADYTLTNEVHCLRDYSEKAVYIGNMCYDCNAGLDQFGADTSNDAEMIYTKGRHMIVTNNILVSPDGGGDSRALLAKKGQPRNWPLYPDLPEQTNAYSNVISNNIFLFEAENRGPATFSESGDTLIINNWFEQCSGAIDPVTGLPGTGGMIMQGSSDIGNLDQVIVIRGNVMRHCTGWLVGGGVKGGTWYIEDNVINSGLLANEKHLGIITMQGQGFTPPSTDVGPGLDENWHPTLAVADPLIVANYMSRGTTYYIRRNSGNAGTQADVWCKSDREAHSLTAIVENNSLVGVVMLVGTSNNAMLRVDIINNDLNGSSNTAKLIDIGSQVTAPKQLRIRGNRGFKRTTTTTATIFVQRFILPTNAVGYIKYRLLGRQEASTANVYYADVTQVITTAASVGAEDRLERFAGTLTANRATITQVGAQVDVNIVGGPAGPTFVWDVDIDAYYDAWSLTDREWR